MGLINIIKPLSTVLSNAINKYRQDQDKNYWERQELNPGFVLGEKQVCYHCYAASRPGPFSIILVCSRILQKRLPLG